MPTPKPSDQPEVPTARDSVQEPVRGFPSVDKWMHSDHYHCRDCGAIMRFITREEWRVTTGVTAWGECGQCGTVMQEREKMKPKWIAGIALVYWRIWKRWALRFHSANDQGHQSTAGEGQP